MNEKKKKDGQRVQYDICAMMSACLQPIQLAIDHVSSNREWVPIA